MEIVIFIAILVILILAHEFGHFIVAKKSGVRVDEFGIGFPPRLLSIKRGETVYSFNLIPFGGFVKIYGENPGEPEDGTDISDTHRSLIHKPKPVQAAVLIGGVLFNFLLAWFLLATGLTIGLPASVSDFPDSVTVENSRLIITTVLPDSPAAKADLKPGDEILGVNEQPSQETIKVPIQPEAVQNFIAPRAGQEIFFKIRRPPEQKILHIKVIPETDLLPTLPSGQAGIGIGMNQVGILNLPPFQAVLYGLRLTGQITVATVSAIAILIVDSFRGQDVWENLVGPVGLAGLVGQTANLGWNYLLVLTALISINLAVINLIPFPALDGGRLLFLLIEALRGKPIKPRILNTLNLIGLVLLCTLMIFVTLNDLQKLF